MILIKGATLIDGAGRAALPASAIVIEGDRFTWVGREADLDKTWKFAKTVDATGKLADLVILNSDPLVKIGNVRDIHAIYLGGAEVKRPVHPIVV